MATSAACGRGRQSPRAPRLSPQQRPGGLWSSALCSSSFLWARCPRSHVRSTSLALLSPGSHLKARGGNDRVASALSAQTYICLRILEANVPIWECIANGGFHFGQSGRGHCDPPIKCGLVRRANKLFAGLRHAAIPPRHSRMYGGSGERKVNNADCDCGLGFRHNFIEKCLRDLS